jgi:flavin-dependent dehydrogenase
MAMAIHCSKIASDLIVKHLKQEHFNRTLFEQEYILQWKNLFAKRLWAGRQIQRLFGNEWTSNLAVNLARQSKPISNWLVKQTHGQPF